MAVTAHHLLTLLKEVARATDAVLTAGQMAGQSSKLVRREEVAEGTMAFHFEKPSGFKFTAGQFADVTLIDPPETDAEGNTRTFSIASPPFENELVFTTRMRDPIPYKELDLNLPWDSFGLAHELTTKGIQKFVADYRSTLRRSA